MSCHLLIQLTPEENTKLLKLLFEHYMQPFEIVAIRKIADHKQVIIQLRSGMRKTYDIFHDGTIRMRRYR